MSETGPLFLARVTSGGGIVDHVWPLTPYEVGIIVEQVRARSPVRLELVVPRDASDDSIAAMRGRFERLAASGVEIRLLRKGGLRSARPRPGCAGGADLLAATRAGVSRR